MRECLWFIPDNTQHSSCVYLFPQMLALFSRNEASLWRQLAHKFHRNFHLIQPLRPAPRGACLHPHYSWPCVSTSKEKIFHEVHLSSLQADTASVNSAVRFWVTGTTLSMVSSMAVWTRCLWWGGGSGRAAGWPLWRETRSCPTSETDSSSQLHNGYLRMGKIFKKGQNI